MLLPVSQLNPMLSGASVDIKTCPPSMAQLSVEEWIFIGHHSSEDGQQVRIFAASEVFDSPLPVKFSRQILYDRDVKSFFRITRKNLRYVSYSCFYLSCFLVCSLSYFTNLVLMVFGLSWTRSATVKPPLEAPFL
jgi:hypothetical protein